MGHNLSGISRMEAARQLEVLAAGLRSGVMEMHDVHARIPDHVQMQLTVKESAVEVTIAWRADLLTEVKAPAAEALLNIDDESPTLQAEARAAEEAKSTDAAVVRAAREGRMS